MIKLEVVTPTGKVLETTANSVTAPGVLGEFCVLPDHQPALIRLGGGTLSYEGKESGEVFIRGGVVEVRADSMLVLADEARTAKTADRAAAEDILKAVLAEAEKSEFIDDEQVQRFNDERAFAEAVLRAVGH